MKLQRYRFNRKVGIIYKESQTNQLIEIGRQMQVIILWASEPVFGQPFPHLPAQDWIQLTFLDHQGDWCYAVLNSGTTNSLYPWIQYRREIYKRSHQLFEILTTISFDSTESDNQWFDYSFSGKNGKPGLGERMRSLIKQSTFPLVDIDLNLPI
ncbi:hypothetical protein ACE1CI_03280 [Aerosakkonemataceae cyanobacterium BLCC-F50]|uniref:Uncharacterized protein n=1 Tax=Floridaenema flaviceps BLCC-F50 TaxID=3153642 RepID=A0ABV4XLT2_9CYAN